jgi:hypothetical protein
LIRTELDKQTPRPSTLHLFLAAPAVAALLLGHDWNLNAGHRRHTDPGYVPTLLVR